MQWFKKTWQEKKNKNKNKKTWQTCTLYSCNFQSFCLKRLPITNFMWLTSIQTTFFKGPKWPRDTQSTTKNQDPSSFHTGVSSNISATVCCKLCHSHHTTPPTMPGRKRHRINACQGRVKGITIQKMMGGFCRVRELSEHLAVETV